MKKYSHPEYASVKIASISCTETYMDDYHLLNNLFLNDSELVCYQWWTGNKYGDKHSLYMGPFTVEPKDDYKIIVGPEYLTLIGRYMCISYIQNDTYNMNIIKKWKSLP